jgi:transposase-like protein
MIIKIGGQTYYSTAAVCQKVGISRNTLFRWLKKDYRNTGSRRDRRGWRLFTEEEINQIKTGAELIIETV